MSMNVKAGEPPNGKWANRSTTKRIKSTPATVIEAMQSFFSIAAPRTACIENVPAPPPPAKRSQIPSVLLRSTFPLYCLFATSPRGAEQENRRAAPRSRLLLLQPAESTQSVPRPAFAGCHGGRYREHLH